MSQNTEKLKSVLVGSGLHANEAAIYLSLLKLGQVGASAISKDTNLHGQIVYRCLEKLLAYGYIKKTTINNRARFSALSPERILSDSQTRTKNLESAIELLKKQSVPAVADQIEIFQGKDQFIENELKNVKKTKRGSEILAISGEDDKYWEVMGSYMNTYDHVVEKRNLSVRYVGSESQREFLSQYEAHNFSYRLLPHNFNGDVNIALFPHAFAMFVFTEPISSIYIHSPKIVDTYKGFFDALWKMGK